MHQQVVPWPTANDTKVVHKGEHRRAASCTRGVEPSYTRSLILVPGRQAHTAYSLGIVASIEKEATIAIKRHVEQVVEVSTECHVFTGSSRCTRNEHGETDGKHGARRHGGSTRLDRGCEHQAEHDCQEWEGDTYQPSPGAKEDGFTVHFLLPRLLFVG